ncbi:hypothetical protein BSL78_12428 [Apostichopus japonicus]|uniref:Uncharacterized protein n=1 Tax=Stichopus japonicus TaxID=307972 RepID=A0A2G8KRV1_STIJA|nr:hypothetical protein BSL78_12428 [Apostichopus japonicus]
MALDYSTDVSSSFLEDNFLSAEDWGFQSDFIHKDVSSEVTSLESFGITLDSQHYSAQDDVSSDSSTKSWNGLDDDFASTVDVDVKGEPCSPQLSQCSSSTESQSSQILQHELLVKLESHTLTPPHEDYPSVASAHLNGYNQDNPNHFNLVDGSIQLPTSQTQNGFIVRSSGGNPAVPNQVHIMNGNIHKGHQIVNGNINLVPTSNGVLVGNKQGCAKGGDDHQRVSPTVSRYKW